MDAKRLNAKADSVALIVEPVPNGHRLYYVGLLIDGCLSKGHRVVVLTTEIAIESAQWRVHLGKHTPEIVLHPPNTFTLQDIAHVSSRLNASITIVPEADRRLLSVLCWGWKGPGELSLLIIRPDLHSEPPLSWIGPVRSLAKKALIRGASFHRKVRVRALRSPLAPRREPLLWAADPVTLTCSTQQKGAMRQYLESYGDLYWFGVFGAISARKNLPLIIEAISNQQDVGLLIAGSVDPQVSDGIAPLLAKLVADGGRVIHLPGPLTDADFDSAIGAVDCVIAAHSNEGSSGVVLKAAASGRRLVLAGAKSLRRDANYLGDQATWSPLEVDALRRAIENARRLPEPKLAVELGPEDFLRALT